MKHGRVLVQTMAVILAAGALLVVPEAVHAQATITVNSTAQEVTLANPTGVTNLNCTLGEAVLAAKTNAVVDTCTAGQTGGTDTIMIPAGTYTFTEAGADPFNNGNPFALPEPGEPVTFQGAGAGTTILERSSAPGTPTLYFLLMGISVSLNDLTVRNFGGPDPHSLAAAIKVLNAPTLSLSNFVLEDTNVNGGGSGAGININQFCITLNITNSTFRNNVNASGAGNGGAIAACGTINISNSSFVDNSTTAGGGALFIRATGGGNDGGATATISNTVFSGNTAGPDNGSGGGAIHTQGGATGTLSISSSLFLANVGHESQSAGGAIENGSMTMTITDSAFLNNSARYGGALYSAGPLTVRNSTFSGNSSCCDGGAMRLNVAADLENVTMVGNSTTGSGGGIFLDSASFNIRNSIVAGNSPGGNFGSPFGGGPGFHEFFSQGHNVLGETDGIFFNAGTGDQVGTGASPLDPQVQSAADNASTVMAGSTVGGQTPQVVQTMALFQGSPALGGGDPGTPGTGSPTCEAADARGIVRPQPVGGVCDTGAFEDLTGNGISADTDLAVSKTDSPDPVDVGADITYSVTVTNNGPGVAADVTLTDPLPAGVTFVSASSPAGWNCTTPAVGANGTITCTIPILVDGAVETFTFVVTPGAAAAPSVSNTATVSATTTDADNSNDTSTAVTTVNPVADVSITKSDAPDPATAGSSLTYTLVVSNAGPSTAQGVVATDTLPAGVAFVSANPTAGSCSQAAGTVTCNLGDVNNGASVTITIVVTPSAAGTLNNSASVSSSTGDPAAGNNSASSTTTVNPAATPDLTLSFSLSSITVNSGASGSSTLTVTGTNGFAGTVTLACNAPSQLQGCALSTTSIPLDQNTTSGTSTVTVSTLGAVAWMPPAGPPSERPQWAVLFTGSLAMLACVVLWPDGRRRKKGHSLLLFLGTLGLLFALSGCGNGDEESAPRTPAGTYFVTITATSGATSKTATLNVVVP